MPGRRRTDVRTIASDLRERGVDVFESIPDRFEQARNVVRDRVDDLEPAARRTGVGVLTLAQALLAVGIAIPRLMARAVRVARILTERAEYVADRGHHWSERAREAAHALEPSRRDQRRRRLRATGLVMGGFGIGFAVGWIMGDARGLAARAAAQDEADAHAREVALADAIDRGEATDRPHLEPVAERDGLRSATSGWEPPRTTR